MSSRCVHKNCDKQYVSFANEYCNKSEAHTEAVPGFACYLHHETKCWVISDEAAFKNTESI